MQFSCSPSLSPYYTFHFFLSRNKLMDENWMKWKIMSCAQPCVKPTRKNKCSSWLHIFARLTNFIFSDISITRILVAWCRGQCERKYLAAAAAAFRIIGHATTSLTFSKVQKRIPDWCGFAKDDCCRCCWMAMLTAHCYRIARLNMALHGDRCKEKKTGSMYE